ncbi:hypothetical protein E2562_005636 [Oryza meyeriana var. granulata]|uniref:Uncharacterized protein n=1 Tax=Oryza meyeriana var. granulata TaxID=110450 RepID=A0A6G1BJF8_9ORYZ|nr:hypothetical protein E2562_005636 [Oryza meyeriana var. granulata]
MLATAWSRVLAKVGIEELAAEDGVKERAAAIGVEELVATVKDAAMDQECRSHQPLVISALDRAASVLGDIKSVGTRGRGCRMHRAATLLAAWLDPPGLPLLAPPPHQTSRLAIGRVRARCYAPAPWPPPTCLAGA